MASSFGERVLSFTNDELLPRAVDTVLNGNVFATRMLSNAKAWKGEQLKRPVKVSKNTTGQAFFGFDTFSTEATDNTVRMAFDPKFYQITAALPLTELSVNSVSESKVTDLMSYALESASHDMADDIGNLFYADGTAQGGKVFLGLAAHVDDGTNVATIGEQSRSTYSTLQSTVTASGGTLSLAKMATLYSAISSGSQKPTIGLATEAVFNLYEQLLQPQERIAKDVPAMRNAQVAGTGFTGLFYKGFPILADEKCTSQTLFFLNEDFLEWRALPVAMTEAVKYKTTIDGNDYGQPMGLGFSWGGWIKPSNAAAVVGHLYLGGNLVGWNPKRHGRLTGITSV